MAWLLSTPRVEAFSGDLSPSKPPIAKINLLPAPVQTDWTGYRLLERIASCESWGDPNKLPRQFKDGKVLRGFPNPDDIGLAQINAPLWEAKAKGMGWDIYTYSGNLKMAKWLFDKYGSNPWNWSKGCWD